MRLMNTASKKLEEPQGITPSYAILSHVWGEDEVLFKDLNDPETAKQKKGYSKIKDACAQAVQDGLEYIWIDTCCINKESSAELSEAINSMYAWYRDARVCYAYLADVRSNEDPESLDSSFSTSKWFTRGWTLQELLAPVRVEFFAGDWVNIGTKSTLQDTISTITGIPIEALLPQSHLNSYDDIAIAVRMSWAAGRETTRVEDIAYSLMGIFDVNMPLLYGEGRKAFIRLQREIISKSDDHSIFAWRDTLPTQGHHFLWSVDLDMLKIRGILARSPMEFQYSNKVERIFGPSDAQIQNATYSMTNRGLHIKLPLIPCNHPKLFVAQLNCHIAGIPVSIILAGEKGDQLARFGPSIFGMELRAVPHPHPSLAPVKAEAVPSQHTLIFVKEDVPDHARPAAHITATVHRSAGYEAQYMVTSKANNSYSQWEHIPGTTAWSMSGYQSPRMGTIILNGVHNMDKCAITCGFRGRVLWVEVVSDFERESAEKLIRSYDLPLSTQHRKFAYSQYLDRSSAILPSGWSVTASSSLTHPVASGDPPMWYYEINIEFERRTSPVFEEQTWVKACQVNASVRQHGFRVVTEDLRDWGYYGNWSKHNDAFVCKLSSTHKSYVLPFKRIDGTSSTEFFLVIEAPGWDRHVLRTAIVTSKPDNPEDALQSKGRVEGSYSVPLYGKFTGRGIVVIDVVCNVERAPDLQSWTPIPTSVVNCTINVGIRSS